MVFILSQKKVTESKDSSHHNHMISGGSVYLTCGGLRIKKFIKQYISQMHCWSFGRPVTEK